MPNIKEFGIGFLNPRTFSLEMISIQEFEQSILDDLRIVKHLLTLVPADAWDYRPSPKQRSTLELVQYLCKMPKAMILTALQSDPSPFKIAAEEGSKLKPSDVNAAIDAEIRDIKKILADITEAQLQEKTDPFKMGPQRKGYLLLNGVLKNTAAYKMQLFLYIKANGRDDIGTTDVWAGFSRPKG